MKKLLFAAMLLASPVFSEVNKVPTQENDAMLKEKVKIEFTYQELAFLKNIVANVVPTMAVPAKDASAILQICKEISDKIDRGGK